MLDLKQVLQSRLQFMEYYAKQGFTPGILDSTGFVQMLGRIDELKFVLALLDSGQVYHQDEMPFPIPESQME